MTAVVAYRAAGRRVMLVSLGCLVVIGAFGVWEEAVQTMALMIVSVVIALMIGVPLGIAAGRNPKVEGAMKGFLDAAQTMPAYCYLIPTVLLFDIGASAAVIATVIFALPPAVRLTAHGIRSVPPGLVEVGESQGATKQQLLSKVQWPIARPQILLGVNQVIMMAFGIVVIAALVGSPGLGQSVLTGLQKVDVGLALDAGIAIVLVAVILDRISGGPHSGRAPRLRPARSGDEAPRPGDRARHRGLLRPRRPDRPRRPVPGRLDLLAPRAGERRGRVAAGQRAHRRPAHRRHVRDQRLHRPAPPRAAAAAAHGHALVDRHGGDRRAGVAHGRAAGSRSSRVACLVAIGGLQFWDHSMDTLSQVIVAVALAVVIAIPIGILAGRSDWVFRTLRPLLDAAQVLPAFVYLIPVIALFNVGRVPGLVASVIYAVPVGIRLTSLGIRQVPAETVEAAVAYGATPRQVLWKVQVPLAVPSIMLGVNQVIMMSLSMVIVAGLVGSGALGLDAVQGLTKSQYELGTGAAAGICIVLLAVVLDRITQAWGQPRRVARDNH